MNNLKQEEENIHKGQDSKNGTGRPSIYSDELAYAICELIAEGKSLVYICRLDGMPRYTTVMRWCRDREEFRELYRQARDDQADFLAEELLEIADDDSLDIGFTDDGKPFVKGENIQRSRLRVDARKWIASKLKPKKYGDRIQQDVGIEAGASLTQLLKEIDGTSKSLLPDAGSNDLVSLPTP